MEVFFCFFLYIRVFIIQTRINQYFLKILSSASISKQREERSLRQLVLVLIAYWATLMNFDNFVQYIAMFFFLSISHVWGQGTRGKKNIDEEQIPLSPLTCVIATLEVKQCLGTISDTGRAAHLRKPQFQHHVQWQHQHQNWGREVGGRGKNFSGKGARPSKSFEYFVQENTHLSLISLKVGEQDNFFFLGGAKWPPYSPLELPLTMYKMLLYIRLHSVNSISKNIHTLVLQYLFHENVT